MSTLSRERSAPDITNVARPHAEQPRALAGFWKQLRFVGRRDRLRMSIWIVSIIGLVGLSALSVLALYTTPKDLLAYAEVAQANAAIKALSGPGYGLDDPTEGAVVMNETSLYTYLGVALMCVFMVTRHTRAEEESGRAELVRSAPVGRSATLAAAIVWVSGSAFVIGAGLAVALVLCGLPLTGSVAFGAATFAIGVVFVGVSAVSSQVASSARSANSIAGAVLGLAFMVRAVGDMGNGWMTWLSPLGITQAIRPYADERWWVLLPLAVLAAASVALGFWLHARRDLGAGILADRPGPATAAPRLSTPFGLALRLQRVSLIGWAAGIGLTGFFSGLIADEAEALADNQAIADIFAASGQGTITETFLATIVLMVALMTMGFTVASVLRLRSEELAGRAEPMLATPVGRERWLWSHFGVALIGSVLIAIVGGLSTGLGYAAAVGSADEVLSLFVAGLVMAVALLVIAAFAAMLVGLPCRGSIAAWGAVAAATVIGLLSETLDLPQWVRDLSPFTHVPHMPAAPFDIVPILIMLAVTAILTGIAMVAIRRRDIG